MVWTPPQNGKLSLVKEDLPVDTSRQEEKRKTIAIMEEPSDGLKRGRNMEEDMAEDRHFLGFGYGQTALSCTVDPNNNTFMNPEGMRTVLEVFYNNLQPC